MKTIRLEDKKVYYVSVYYFDTRYSENDTMVEVLDEIIELTGDETISDIKKMYRNRFPYDNIDIKKLSWTCEGIEFTKDI